MKRTQTILITTVILSMALTSVFALDYTEQEITSMNSSLPFAEATVVDTHSLTMEAVAMPDGMYAYRMVSYKINNGPDLVGTHYSDKPSIPGPTIILNEGDKAIVQLINSACKDTFIDGPGHPLDPSPIGPLATFSETSMLGIHVHGVHYDISDDATYPRMNMSQEQYAGALCDDDITYEWFAAAGTAGAWPYHDHTFSINEIGAEELGLFGTVIVNPPVGEKVNGLVDENGVVQKVPVSDIKKDFVLWMVSTETLGTSIFYGNEIDYDTDEDYSKSSGTRETALWTNPTLVTTHDEVYRVHVLGLGDEVHAFHLHGHRWTEDIHQDASVEDIIDVKEISPLQRHTFLFKASDNNEEEDGKGTEGWMYHCHVLDHMKQGMSGMMTVLPGSDDLPIVGAVFTLSDEPGLWMKTLNAGFLDTLDDILAGSDLTLPGSSEPDFPSLNADPDEGTGFPIDYLEVLSPEFGDSEARSLAVINQGETVLFGMKDSQTKHTITALIYPTDAQPAEGEVGGNGILSTANIGFFDHQLGIRGSTFVTDNTGKPIPLQEPGIYVFVCKIHPYMFGAVIVDDDTTNIKLNNVNKGSGGAVIPLLDLSENLTVLTRAGSDFPLKNLPPEHPLITTLLKTFYIITDPANWKDYDQTHWNVNLPPAALTGNSEDQWIFLVNQTNVDFIAFATDPSKPGGGAPAELIVANLESKIPITNSDKEKPDVSGVGEVWVNTQFERTVSKNHEGTPFDKPGTITVVNTDNWSIEQKIALPEINMNHPHNMWTDRTNEVIYQTQWFGNEMAVIDRESGELIKEVFVGQSPSHVMTSPTTDKVYLAINGEETVNEFDPETYEMTRQISTGFRSHPHGHWASSDGQYIVTPDFIGLKASIIDLTPGAEVVTSSSSLLYGPIATGMKGDVSEFFTADFLGNMNTSIDTDTGNSNHNRNIDWLAIGAAKFEPDALLGLPIQTPISPDDKWMVTALTLGSKIGVVNVDGDGPITADDVTILPCDPGCHGVQWGAKEDGGYLAYVSSKFSNALIVVDPETDEGPAVVGKIILADNKAEIDDPVIGYGGMGGQGVLAIPNVYDGWIQQTVLEVGTQNCDKPGPPQAKGKGPCDEIGNWLSQLSSDQQAPISPPLD
jgi:FtsP/CotA-like multicopper oxidase with cupredoxin domain/DNA-binding beta-propeller fold protein YncE/plastocyanin